MRFPLKPLLLLVIFTVPATQSNAEEVSLLRITELDGEFISRYQFDNSSDTDQSANTTSEQTQVNLRQELALRTSGYIYHPNLISLDLRGGPIFEQSSFELDEENIDQDQIEFGIFARATILREKPYRGALFIDKSHPTLLVGFAETATTDNLRYGGEVDLLEPFTPLPLHFDLSREENETNGSLRSSEDDIDRFNFRARQSLGVYGSSSLHLQSTQQESSSKSPGVAAQFSSFDDQGLNLDTRLKLGNRQQYNLNNSIVMGRQRVDISEGDIPDRDSLRVSFDLRGQHSDKLRSFSSYTYDDDDRGDVSYRFNQFSAGATYQPDDSLWLTGGVQGDRATSQALSNDSYGANGSVRFDRDLPIGSATLSYGIRHDRRSQVQNDDDFEIIGEQITLAGLTPVTLSQPRVITSTITVSNLSRTQIFIEDVDYEVSVVGIDTRINRLAGGAILDPEQVLVDYSVEVGGTFRSSQTDHNFAGIWHISPHIEAQYRGFLSRPEVTSGEATFELNKVTSHLFTLQGDRQIPGTRDMRIGGRTEYEDRAETVESFTRSSVELFTEGSLPFYRSAHLRLGTRRTNIKHDDAEGDSEFRSWDMNLGSRHSYGINLSFDASYEEDLAERAKHSRLRTRLSARARYRRLSFNGEIGYTRDRQGDFDRGRTHALIEVRRELF